jgi:AAA15 family ATPase/GTPase
MSTTVEEIEKTETSEGKKSELLLDSLEIKGYRCFEHLTIEKLGRVNLIVGKNNVGKTALLEALWFYAQGGHEINQYLVATTVLFNRNERMTLVTPHVRSTVFLNFNPLTDKSNYSLNNLFYNRPEAIKTEVSFQIGSKNDYEKQVRMIFQIPSKINQSIKFEPEKNQEFAIRNEFVSLNGINSETLTTLFDNIVLTKNESLIVESLQMISSKLKNVGLIGFGADSSNRIPVAKTDDFEKPVPLRSLGEGMNRLFGIALALVNCEDGMLFIDEIESGLHYSVLPDVWKLIFKTAKDLNVQVFATTHSSDCVKAFQRAAEEDKEDEGILIRLVRKGDKIKAILFDEEELETAVENDIEVR